MSGRDEGKLQGFQAASQYAGLGRSRVNASRTAHHRLLALADSERVRGGLDS